MHAIPLSALAPRRLAIANAFRNRQYERTPSGIFFPKVGGGLGIQGVFEHWLNGKDHQVEPNLIVNTGLNHLLSAALAGGSAISSWYVAPFSGNVTPVAGTTAATFTAVATETTAYDEAARVAWAYDAVASQAISNNSTRATFTMNATVSVYGAGILSASAKSSTSGTLLCYAKFAAVRAMVDDDVLTIKYTISATSS